MHLSSDVIAKIELLNLFSLDSTQEGLKVHHEAEHARIAAAQSLFDDGMITLCDGGYLTPRGIEAAEHAQALINILKAS